MSGKCLAVIGEPETRLSSKTCIMTGCAVILTFVCSASEPSPQQALYRLIRGGRHRAAICSRWQGSPASSDKPQTVTLVPPAVGRVSVVSPTPMARPVFNMRLDYSPCHICGRWLRKDALFCVTTEEACGHSDAELAVFWKHDDQYIEHVAKNHQSSAKPHWLPAGSVSNKPAAPIKKKPASFKARR